MKTRFYFLVLFFCWFNGQSQNQSDKLNIVKTNVTAYAFKNFNLTYERAILKWLSLNVSYGTIPSGKISFVDKFIEGSDGKEFSNVRLGSSQFTIEPRFYISGNKSYGEGFYLAPYYRYTNIKLEDAVYNFYSETLQTDISLNISGNATGNSAGLMIGYQWFLGAKKNWVLDLWMIGGHYGKGKGDFNGTTNRILTAQEQNQLRNELQNLDIPIVDYEITTNERGANIKVDGPWAGLRSGLSFGYRF